MRTNQICFLRFWDAGRRHVHLQGVFFLVKSSSWRFCTQALYSLQMVSTSLSVSTANSMLLAGTASP